jgi:hypothetical protein
VRRSTDNLSGDFLTPSPPCEHYGEIGGPDLGPANPDARQRRELTNRIGRNVTRQNQPNQKWQLTGGTRAASDRVLRNSFFANKPPAGDPAARRLADPDHSLPPGMYVDVPHLDCLLVAAPITMGKGAPNPCSAVPSSRAPCPPASADRVGKTA